MRYSVPGIFIEPEPERIEPISISKRCLAGFVGIAERGPINEGVRITSFQEYQKLFGGFGEYGYLPYSVYGFFNSGGEECIVVRIAHTGEDEYSLSSAYLDLVTETGEISCRFVAKSSGAWGNRISVKLWYTHDASSYVEENTNNNQRWIILKSTEGFSSGDMVIVQTGSSRELKRISRIEENRLYFTERLERDYNLSAEAVICQNVMINLVLTEGNKAEEYFFLSPNEDHRRYFPKIINEQSELLTTAVFRDGELPSEIKNYNLHSGRSGVLNLSPADFIGRFNGLNNNSGLGVLEGIDKIDVISVPDVLVFQEAVHNSEQDALNDMLSVQRAMIDQCELNGNRFALLDMPAMDDTMQAIKWAGKFDTAYAAMYYPKVEILNPGDATGLSSLLVPPSGHIAGVISKTDREEGKHQAPANRLISGAVGIARKVPNDEYELLYPRGINCLKYIPGRGIKIWGARTLAGDPEWKYINVRRAFSAIKDAIQNGAGWAVFEPNNPQLRKRLVRHISAFLLDLWRTGYLAGSVPEEGFFIRCDDELNPPEQIDAGIITVEVGIAIVRPAEFLVVTILSDRNGSLTKTG